MHGIKERKIHNMLWDSVKYFAVLVLAGLVSGLCIVGILMIYIRMAGPI